jgi:FKBP-type peptidyl-prolyl cis-trans isomerase SlpA
MSTPTPVIGPGMRVTLHFRLALANGEQVDATRQDRPATFRVGDGRLPAGIERRLFGLAAGAEVQIELAPADAFGDVREENVRFLPRRQFGPAVTPEPGLVVSFMAPEGELPGVIRSIEGELVVVDFNHPLAGRRLSLDVSILAVENAHRSSL